MGKSKRLNRDHGKKTQRPMVEDRVIAEHLTALLTPAIKSQSRHFRELGLRDRILTLPLMVGAVLTSVVERRSWSNRIKKITRNRRILMVWSNQG